MAGVAGMYETFYKLHPTPFRLTPDPHFFFESETHKRGLSYLRFAIYQREGFVVITGAPGTGKTELMLNIINELPHNKITLAKIVTTNLDADDLLDLVAASFQINPENMSKGMLLKKLEEFFIREARSGKQVLLMIDEAHNLSVNSFIELSMLENFQLEEKPVMQCFLLGQLPLEEKLNLPELDPLKQRVLASSRLESLDQYETRAYILHRLCRSGWSNNPVFHDKVFSLIHKFSKGVPRKINSLCNRLLLHSYLAGQHEISIDMGRQVIKELQEEAVSRPLDLDFSELESMTESSMTANQQEIHGQEPVKQQVLGQQQWLHDDNSVEKRYGSDAAIDAPEFVKNREAQSTSVHRRILSKNKERETKKSHWANVYSLNTGTTHPTSRPSGLLDKELQFLSSLSGSTKPTEQKSTQADATTPSVPEITRQQPTSERKVIIDPSLQEEYPFTDEDAYHELSITDALVTSLKTHWRQITTVAVILAGLGLSIHWGYNGNSVPVSQISESPSDFNSNIDAITGREVASTTAPTEIEPPIEPSSNTSEDTTNITSDTATEIASSEFEFSVIDYSNASDTPASSGLETQLAHLVPATDTWNAPLKPDPYYGVTESSELEAEQKLATLLSDEHSIDFELDNAQPGATPAETMATTDTATVISSATANNTQSATVEPDKKSSGSPVSGSPLVKAPSSRATDIVVATPKPETRDTTIARRGNTLNIPARESQPVISQTDLTALLYRLSTAYEKGNLQQLANTFATDIYSSDGSNRQQLEKDYQHLFNITDQRHLTIQDVTWSMKNNQMLGSGDFEVLIREKGATRYTWYRGKINLTVAKESDKVVIKKLDHDYRQ